MILEIPNVSEKCIPSWGDRCTNDLYFFPETSEICSDNLSRESYLRFRSVFFFIRWWSENLKVESMGMCNHHSQARIKRTKNLHQKSPTFRNSSCNFPSEFFCYSKRITKYWKPGEKKLRNTPKMMGPKAELLQQKQRMNEGTYFWDLQIKKKKS